MIICSTDVTKQFQFIFDGINGIYNFLLGVEFTAFGFTFSLLGIFIAFMFLVIVIKFLKFGFEDGVSSVIHYHRKENKKSSKSSDDGYIPKHAKKEYVPRHGKE